MLKIQLPLWQLCLLLCIALLSSACGSQNAAEEGLNPNTFQAEESPTPEPTFNEASSNVDQPSTDCLPELNPHELAQPKPSKNNEPRYTLSEDELANALDVMRIQSLCIPEGWGAPFINADWNSQEGSADSGRMLSLGFESLYSGAGWSQAALVYGTYDFAAGTEYEVFASRQDYEMLMSGEFSDALSVDGVQGFVRFHKGIPMGMQTLYKTIVFPFENDYLAFILTMGAFDPTEVDAAAARFAAGKYPPDMLALVSQFDLLVDSVKFRGNEDQGFALYLLEGVDDPRDLKDGSLERYTLKQPALISSEDIVDYDMQTHTLELSAAAFQRVKGIFTLPVDVNGIPFVTVVDGDPIYHGAFYTPASSLSYNGVIILQPLGGEPNSISIQLGYPSIQAFEGQDPRSDARIQKALQELDD